jgi:ankyrin repeat protein
MLVMRTFESVSVLLISASANVKSLDAMGNDAFMYASTYGRPKNLQCWFERVKHYNLECQNTVLGTTPLIFAGNMGSNKFDTMSILQKQGTRADAVNLPGLSVLMAACENEDSDPNVVKEILKLYDDAKDRNFNVNYRMRSQTTKWKLLRGTAKLMVRTGLSKSNLMSRLAQGAGMTALHYAARRGDVEIVKLLLEGGADPYVENDLGVNAFEICNKFGPFQSLMKVLQLKKFE